MKENEITVSATFPLAGTLTIPEKQRKTYPAVLIVAGSGKADRDGNVQDMPMNMYKDLATFLTKQGYITLRYDKRGIGKSEGNYMEAGLSDFIQDAADLVSYLKDHRQVNAKRVYILGHSEGALIAPAVHEKTPVSGLILLAGGAEPSIDLLPRQNERAFQELNALPGFKGWFIRTFKVTDRSRKTNEKIFKKIAESDQAVMRIKGATFNAKWLRETMQYNVVDYLKEVTCPVLAITGAKDVQVPPEHAEKVAAYTQGEAEWHIIPDMNHVLKKYDGEHTMLSVMKEYHSVIDEPLHPKLLDLMKNWLKKHSHH